ncbi:MAG: LPXTG cell wall anchor domain-containing protein, partial [Deltaproteobacteria bacterium]|nr:LPXTG cell wall anchor domain-containing protein [Deltaproteobacteria bacterium]
TAYTCFVLLKLEERAYELVYDSPFDQDYPYWENVVAGWQYVFNSSRTLKQTPLGLQDHTALPGTGTVDDPDTNSNGYGVYFVGSGHPVYTTGVCLIALEASGTPDRANDGGLDFDSNGTDTFKELAQEAADWLAWAQADSGIFEGGWSYQAKNNLGDHADQSNSGFAVMGLAAAEAFSCTVPSWVKTELNVWIGAIQYTGGGDDDGGSRYTPISMWVNQYKTGHLIMQMVFVGDDTSTSRFQDALAYIEWNWRDADDGCSDGQDGWGYNVSPASYLAMFSLMKGLVYAGIDLLDTDGDTSRDDDWFNQEPPVTPAEDFASVLVAQQNADGSWSGCCWGSPIMCTVWSLLTLEKISPEPPGSITIKKMTDRPELSGEFEFIGQDVNSPDEEPIAFYLSHGDSLTETEIPPGDYSVVESYLRLWQLTDVVCTGGDYESIPGGVLIHLDAGEDVICTFNNKSEVPIPSLTHWGVIIGFALLMGAGLFRIRKKRKN